ncbi:hypothetical protein C8J57DRAFT_1484200 [Mycena rebaudengoi]|nr:hypothetical protein C8J57DRAFT_1484200 [Mycena rebaudengoi]
MFPVQGMLLVIHYEFQCVLAPRNQLEADASHHSKASQRRVQHSLELRLFFDQMCAVQVAGCSSRCWGRSYLASETTVTTSIGGAAYWVPAASTSARPANQRRDSTLSADNPGIYNIYVVIARTPRSLSRLRISAANVSPAYFSGAALHFGRVKPSILSVSPVVFPADLPRRSVTRSLASHHHSSLLDVRVCREHALMGWPDDSEETLGDGALEAADTPRYFDTGLEPPIAHTQDTASALVLELNSSVPEVNKDLCACNKLLRARLVYERALRIAGSLRPIDDVAVGRAPLARHARIRGAVLPHTFSALPYGALVWEMARMRMVGRRGVDAASGGGEGRQACIREPARRGAADVLFLYSCIQVVKRGLAQSLSEHGLDLLSPEYSALFSAVTWQFFGNSTAMSL